MCSEPSDDMPPKMRKFLAKPPRHLSDAAILARHCKQTRRGKPKGWLEELCALQAWKCAYCNRNMSRMKRGREKPNNATLDHVLPISRGGKNQRSNLVAACLSCNREKGAMTDEEYRVARLNPTHDGEGE